VCDIERMYGAHLMIKDIQMRKTSVILWKKKEDKPDFQKFVLE